MGSRGYSVKGLCNWPRGVFQIIYFYFCIWTAPYALQGWVRTVILFIVSLSPSLFYLGSKSGVPMILSKHSLRGQHPSIEVLLFNFIIIVIVKRYQKKRTPEKPEQAKWSLYLPPVGCVGPISRKHPQFPVGLISKEQKKMQMCCLQKANVVYRREEIAVRWSAVNL